MFDQHVLTTLRGWAATLQNDIEQEIKECYVFGSLVNAEGSVFSKEESDIDLIILTTNDDAEHLVMLMIKLAPKVDQLEELLKKVLQRENDEPITSTTLVTKFEMDQGIHKDRNSRIFFAAKAFLPVMNSDQPAEQPDQFGNALKDDLVKKYFPIWTVMANTQSQRNKFLQRNLGCKDFDGEVLILPKDLLRNAYAVHCFPENPNFIKDDDLAIGLRFLKKELEIKSSYVTKAYDLLKLLDHNGLGTKRERQPISAVLLLYAWELIRDCAQSLLASQRASKASKDNRFASKKVVEELVRYQVASLKCIDTAIQLYCDPDLVGTQPTIPITITQNYVKELYEIDSLDKNQLTRLSAEWPDDIKKHLQERFEKEGSEHSECKVGFERINFSHRGTEENKRPSLSKKTYDLLGYASIQQGISY